MGFPLIFSFYSAIAFLLHVVVAINSPCCNELSGALPGFLFRENDSQYSSIKNTFFSAANRQISPACFLQPSTTAHVSIALQILSKPDHRNIAACRFAIRSGGHATWGGAANVEGGVTIDLSNLKEVSIHKEANIVSVGPGNSWGEVYNKIEPEGLAVSGSYWANTGVGGMLLGGGISFFMGEHGLPCDNVANHEVVLANGTIVNANRNENADLHKALKGGSNNFGIVTRFDLKSHSQGRIWSGYATTRPDKTTEALTWLQNFANSTSLSYDTRGMVLFTLGTFFNINVGMSQLTYLDPVANPPLLQGFFNVSGLNTMKITTYNAIAQENAKGTQAGQNTLWATFTFINNKDFMSTIVKMAEEKKKDMPPFAPGINVIFAPIWKTSRDASFLSGGGNSLGLNESDDDLIVVLLSTSWFFVDRGPAITKALREFVDQVQVKAMELGIWNRYIEPNFAADFQDVMAGFGQNALTFLRETSVKFDPEGVFQERVPGGFKLWKRKGVEKPWVLPPKSPKSEDANEES